jgi:hypothetical protein
MGQAKERRTEVALTNRPASEGWKTKTPIAANSPVGVNYHRRTSNDKVTTKVANLPYSTYFDT